MILTAPQDSSHMADFHALLGDQGWITDQARAEPYLKEWRGRYSSACIGIARPQTTEECAASVRLCRQHNWPITPQGGNTGLVGGAVADGGVIVSLDRLCRIRETDPSNRTMSVDGGCTLEDIHTIARRHNLFFPLRLASQGSCHIGGNLSTNAGGNTVLRYGNARDLVLGLEVVLPNGEIWHGMNKLRKDNTGYDLKHLFMGAEGTLGIITGAVLKLYGYPQQAATALVGVPDAERALTLLDMMRDHFDDTLSSFELIDSNTFHCVLTHGTRVRNPFECVHPVAVLLEITCTDTDTPLYANLESVLADALNNHTITTAVIAQDERQRVDFWHLREQIPPSETKAGPNLKHDISVAVSTVPTFLHRATACVHAIMPEIKIMAFGHMGDGNIHYNLLCPAQLSSSEIDALRQPIQRALHDLVTGMGGSISAEHGIGLCKRDELARYKDTTALTLMRHLKNAIDPHNLMNPGKVLPAHDAASGIDDPFHSP